MFLDELGAYIIAAGIATVVYKSTKVNIPTGAGPYVQLTETGGLAGLKIQNQRASHLERPGAQIRVRASNYADAYATAKAIYRLFEQVRNQDLSGVFYLEITPLQNVFDMSLDDTGRAQAGFNLFATKEPS